MLATRPVYDLGIIGGGIVGLATARQAALRHPNLRICVLEKEGQLAEHQSKRNSGVVHQGIYYKKGTLKSKFCKAGARQALEYCKKNNIPLLECGKLIVATQQDQLEQLHSLFKNAKDNEVEGVELVTSDTIKKIQPGCTKAIEAIWSPKTTVVNWQLVALSYAKDFEELGGKILNDFKVTELVPLSNQNIVLKETTLGKVVKSAECKSVVCCTGVYSHFFAAKTGNSWDPRVIPFKGLYFHLRGPLATTIKTNIYPLPDPKLPFLGVHITPQVDGSVIVGPTAGLSHHYEGYQPMFMNPRHVFNMFYRSGLTKLLRKREFIAAAVQEIKRTLSNGALAKEVRELLPAVNDSDLIDNNFCGIRAQCISRRGELVEDFLFESANTEEYKRVLHVRNCPSPAATSAIAISERIVNILEERLI